MDIKEFHDKIEHDPAIKGMGITDNGAVVDVGGDRLEIPINAIADREWDEIRGSLVGDRDPMALDHVTRIVGYFSKITNWNASKERELEDRHQGTYKI